tara:strand:+ start:605 stop:802 length:198 start_codon:yes stop_codon:yes gene_type:complete
MKIILVDLMQCSDDCFSQIESKEDLLTELNAECYGEIYTDMQRFARDYNKNKIKGRQMIIKIIEE